MPASLLNDTHYYRFQCHYLFTPCCIYVFVASRDPIVIVEKGSEKRKRRTYEAHRMWAREALNVLDALSPLESL